MKDIPPYMTADGDPVKVYGTNKIGLERHGIPADTQKALLKAYKLVYRSNLLTEAALERIEAELPHSPELDHFVEFIRTSQRGIAR